MTKKEVCKSTLKKVGKIIVNILSVIFVIMFSLSILSSILAAIFMIIQANNGYLSPWMLRTIEMEKRALYLWANS